MYFYEKMFIILGKSSKVKVNTVKYIYETILYLGLQFNKYSRKSGKAAL